MNSVKLFLEKNKISLFFFLLLIIAIGTRLYSWPYGILGVNVDEAMTAVNANFMAKFGVDMYHTSFPVYLEAWQVAGQSVMLFYMMAICFKIFGISMFSVRLPMLVVSSLSLCVWYDLIKRIFKNSKIALFAMGFVSISPWHFMQSIWSIDCNMFPHFMLFSVYFLYRGITDKKGFLFLSMCFFALTMYTYGVSIYVVPFFLLCSAIYLLQKKIVDWKTIFCCVFLYLLVSGPIYIMYIINALKIDTIIHIGPITIQYFANSVRTKDMLFFSSNILKTLLTNLLSLGKTLVLQYDGLEWNATKIFGTVYHFSLIFFAIGIFALKKVNGGGI